MKKKLHKEKKLYKDVFTIGHTKIDLNNLKAIEAISLTLVGILSITAGTLYGTIMF